MDRHTEKRLLEYLGMSIRDLIISIAITIAASTLLGFWVMRHHASVTISLLAALLLALVLLLISGGSFLLRRRRANALYSLFRSRGTWDLLVEDFAKAVPVGKDVARIGERYVFACSHALVCELEDIFGLVTDPSPEPESALKALDIDGKPFTLCFLPQRGAKAAQQEIIAEIKKRCPRQLDDQ